jgi:hypothetical protein
MRSAQNVCLPWTTRFRQHSMRNSGGLLLCGEGETIEEPIRRNTPKTIDPRWRVARTNIRNRACSLTYVSLLRQVD